MNTGKILVAYSKGIYVLKFIGDVRLTLCTALDIFLERMSADKALQAVFIDLSDTEAIDSTSLGFIAKISILTNRHFSWLPTLISTNPDINRLIDSMGFDQVFNIIHHRIDQENSMEELPLLPASEAEIKERVLEAHKILMGLNEKNRSQFKELVEMLEAS